MALIILSRGFESRPTARNRIPFELEELVDGTSIVTAEARFAGVSEPLPQGLLPLVERVRLRRDFGIRVADRVDQVPFDTKPSCDLLEPNGERVTFLDQDLLEHL